MKNMLIAAVVFVLGFGFAASAWAQDKAPTAGAAKKVRHPGFVAKKLNLTDAQKAQIKEILQQAKADAAKVTDKAAKMEIMKAAREKIRTTVLTDEQRKQLGEAKRPVRPMIALRKLNLTDDQKAKVKEIMTQASADAAKATDPKAKAEVRKNAWEKVKTDVLTDAQRKQLEEMKANRKAGKAPAAAPAKT